MVGRFGGVEFLIILPTGDKRRARKIARKGSSRIGEKNSLASPTVVQCQDQYRVATYPDDGGTAEDMFKADGALYMVKRKRREQRGGRV